MKIRYAIIGGAVALAALITFLNLTSQIRIHQKHTPVAVAKGVGVSQFTAVPTGNTLASIQDGIAKREYNITYDSTHHALQSPNRRHNLRAYYRPGKLTIQNRVDSTGQNFRMELVNEGIYADGMLVAASQSGAALQHQNDTLRIVHRHFTEEFINNQAGVRQNFIVADAPAGTRQLAVRLSVHGLYARQQDMGEVIFYSEKNGKKTDRLTYSDLNCWDADGKPLTASLAVSNAEISINVDVNHAKYPVTIDPIITNGSPANADKTLEINQTSAWLGFSVSSAGDVNGDGYSDVLVGAPKYDNGQADEGAAFLYPGTAGGISLAATVLECNQAGAQMGYSVSNAGDINKDGFSDILVGAPYYDASASNEGVVMIYKGSAGGLVTNSPYVFKLDQAEANLGISVAMAGDVNGDGYSDMLAGAHQFDNGQSNEGVGVLILGAPNGLGLVTFMECNQPNAMMGFAVAGAGDVDGDGFSDVMAGARFYSNGQALEGAAFIFKGSANGLVTANPTVIESNQVDARLGHALSSAGDVNGDGFSDIALGAYLYDKGSSNEGVVMIHLGGPNGIGIAPSQTLENDQTEAQFGISVACAGDVNGDGYADLIAGARYYDKGHLNEGAAFIYQGSPAGLNPVPTFVIESNQGDAWMGSAVASAGDVNGDGLSDVLVGSYAFDHGQTDEGSVFVWLGQSRGISADTKEIISADDNYDRQFLGRSVSGAGDVNGDGFGDFIIGAPGYLNNKGCAFIYHGTASGIADIPTTKIESSFLSSQFAFSSCGGGDINGDGFADVIVGAIEYTNGEANEGAAFIYFGSPVGITEQGKVTTEGNKPQINFGFCVSNNFDVNNDGFSDVIIGAKYTSEKGPSEGEAHVYLGSPTGINLASLIVLKGDKPDAFIGNSVAGAGDLNGDGYDEVIVGACNYDGGKGAAFIFNGSASGVNTIASLILKCDQQEAEMGNSVNSAGDINGDGYSDVIIGSHLYDTTTPDFSKGKEGRVFIYYGSSSGINSQAFSVLKGPTQYWNQRFGFSISSAGDVNGDGYSDVIIGADFLHINGSKVFEGVAYIFEGSSTGINPNSSFFVGGEQTGAHLGRAVAGIEDINGDGVSDVIIGAPSFDHENGVEDTGRAIVYYGNDASKLRNNLRLYNADLTTPINHNQFAQPNFGASLFAKSFTGRNKGKLVWETKPINQEFSKGSNNRITNSTQSTGSQNAYASLGTTGIELKNVIDKQGAGTKVRVRVQYDPVLALTGQSYGPWRYLPAYLMGNSTAPVPEEAEEPVSENMRRENRQVKRAARSEPVTVYPNPVADRLDIDLKDKDQVQSLRIHTASGSMVYQASGFQSWVDVSKLSQGVYFLTVTKTDGSHTTRKILIRR